MYNMYKIHLNSAIENFCSIIRTFGKLLYENKIH